LSYISKLCKHTNAFSTSKSWIEELQHYRSVRKFFNIAYRCLVTLISFTFNTIKGDSRSRIHIFDDQHKVTASLTGINLNLYVFL